MALWFPLYVNNTEIGCLTVTRQVYLNTHAAGAADAVSPYSVELDGKNLGTVTHRYGDGAWALVRKAIELVPGARTGLPSSLAGS